MDETHITYPETKKQSVFMQQESSITVSGGSRLRRGSVILVACVCGWFIMELEILGVRMLAPYFGSAVYVVTGSVIGTFLLSLSIGYMAGGWLSAHSRSKRNLGISVTAAGLWVAILPWITEPVCDWIFNMAIDEKWGSLLAALILFAMPTMLLGTVSPTVVRWLTTHSADSGFNAGLVLGSSTVASFAGCVVTAFYLILFSMKLTLWISGGVLAVLGILIVLVTGAAGDRQPGIEQAGEKA